MSGTLAGRYSRRESESRLSPRTHSLLLAFALAAPLVGGPATPASGSEAQWESYSDKDGVHVYTRAADGTSIKDVMATAVVEAPPEQVLAVLGDVEAYPEVMPPTESAKLIGRSGATAWYYMVLNPGWITRRDYCIRASLSRLANGAFKSEWAIDGRTCPAPRASLVRMVRNEGQWLLSPLAGGKATSVVYQAHSEPGGSVPAWMVNSGTARGVPGVIKAVQKAVTQSRYIECAKDVARCLGVR